MSPSLVARVREQRRVIARGKVRQFQLFYRGQRINIVWSDGAAGQLEDRQHERAAPHLRVVRLKLADHGLGHAQRFGRLLLCVALALAPVGKTHPKPPGLSDGERVYCHSLYSLAIYKQMLASEYCVDKYPVFFMKPGNRLREMRKRAGLTQHQLAEKSGVSQPAISQMETGLGSMDVAWLRAFARILGCTPADLLDDDDNPDRLDAHERLLVTRYRKADATQRETLEKVTAVIVPIAANEEQAA